MADMAGEGPASLSAAIDVVDEDEGLCEGVPEDEPPPDAPFELRWDGTGLDGSVLDLAASANPPERKQVRSGAVCL